jgi:hypothetical protein
LDTFITLFTFAYSYNGGNSRSYMKSEDLAISPHVLGHWQTAWTTGRCLAVLPTASQTHAGT